MTMQDDVTRLPLIPILPTLMPNSNYPLSNSSHCSLMPSNNSHGYSVNMINNIFPILELGENKVPLENLETISSNTLEIKFPAHYNVKSEGNTKSQRKKFSSEEDEKLKQLVADFGPKKWDLIAQYMSGRTGRQCRDRYRNYLMPGFFNGEWTNEEDQLLFQKFSEIGPQWSRLTQYFPNRSSNALKNRWNYFVSRQYPKNQIVVENDLKKLSKNYTPDINSLQVQDTPLMDKYFPNIDNFDNCDFFDSIDFLKDNNSNVDSQALYNLNSFMFDPHFDRYN